MITTQFRSTAHHRPTHHPPLDHRTSRASTMNVLSPTLQLLPTPHGGAASSSPRLRRGGGGGEDDPLRDEEEPSSSHEEPEDPDVDEAEDGDDEEEDAEMLRRRLSTPIEVPGPHDVLLGRGGGTNNHHGNVKFRQLVGEHKLQYFAASKVQKPRVARLVVDLWRKLDPPGRFLERPKTQGRRGAAGSRSGGPSALQGAWYEVGDKKAREKASQCLRERTAEVKPYIKKLREHQDAITEQGVQTFQQRVQLHEEEQRLAAATAVEAVAAAASIVMMPPSGAVVTPKAVPSADDAMEGFDASGRGSYPAVPPSLMPPYHPSPYDARYAGTPLPHAGLSRRTSCPTVAGPPPPAAPSSAAASRRCSLPAVTSSSAVAAAGGLAGHYAPVDYGKFHGGPYDSEYSAYYPPESELDYAYQQSLMEMQRQMHLQELQMQEMQQRMRLQQHRMRQQQLLRQRSPHHPQQQPVLAFPAGSNHSMQSGTVLSSHAETHRDYDHDDDDDDDDHLAEGLDPLPMHEDPLLTIPVRTTAPESTAVPLVVLADSPGRSSPGSDSTGSNAKKNKRSRDNAEEGANQPRALQGTSPTEDGTTKPVSVSDPPTPSEGDSAAAAAHQPEPLPSSAEVAVRAKDDVATALSSALAEEGEITIEEYRRQLEEYMHNNHLGAPGASHHDDYDEDDEPSDLDDDDDEPKYLSVAATARPRRRGSRNSRGGVDRTVSGCSFMSTDTFNSNLSIFSNMSLLSATMSSAAGSDAGGGEGGSGARESKMNMARSVSSNLSLMSDVTDVSQAIDDLRL